jgi:hypothetical protein
MDELSNLFESSLKIDKTDIDISKKENIKDIYEISLKIDNTNLDISKKENIKEIYETSLVKKWIKLISLNKTIDFDSYNRKEYFKPIANITLDTDIFLNGAKNGNKKRNTLIKFDSIISQKEFNKKTEWLYIFLINNHIVKIGGTRTGLKGRISSYLCGHHVQERGKSGDCSKTNGFIYNTFVFYLNLGCKIEMFGYELPKKHFEIDIFGEKTIVYAQTYHAYESKFLEDYKKTYNDFPILSDNGDPDYRIKNEKKD